MNQETRAAQVCAALNATGSRYLVIGGIACALHGYARATSDIDILIERTPENARAVLDALGGKGWGFAQEWRPEAILARPITVIGDDPQVDIFTVAWNVQYADAVDRSSVVDLEGVPVPLIGIDDLIATKRTDRPLDTADIEALERIKRLRT
ncbi:MAG TPA: hypothetical protein VGA20_05670 [Gemmatimonadales bacterium]